jgi:hypothetical protein
MRSVNMLNAYWETAGSYLMESLFMYIYTDNITLSYLTLLYIQSSFIIGLTHLNTELAYQAYLC